MTKFQKLIVGIVIVFLGIFLKTMMLVPNSVSNTIIIAGVLIEIFCVYKMLVIYKKQSFLI